MASTEQRSGFRLPWGSAPTTDMETPAPQANHRIDEPNEPSDVQETETMGTMAAENEALTAATAAFPQSADTTAAGSADPATPASPQAASEPGAWPAHDVAATTAPASTPITAAPAAPAPATLAAPTAPAALATNRPPSRFLADLVRAMRSTAEENRTNLIDAMTTEGKISVDEIHARSAAEIDGLRRVADEDVAGIKDWSKAEIARIRTETEERIAERKQELELSLEGHAALIEREIEHVQARIAEYEAEMDAFFVRLEEIEDPSEFAAVAAEMPEPPSLEEASAAARAAALDELIRTTSAARVSPEPTEALVAPVATDAEVIAPADSQPSHEPVAEPLPDEPLIETQARDVERQADEPEAIAAEPIEAQAEPIKAQAEAVEAQAEAVAEPAVAAPAVPETIEEPTTTEEIGTAGDPRLAALGLTADAAEPAVVVDEPRIDALSESTIAARLGDPSANGRSAPESNTSVVVVGLVSVASVAAFKRTLGKVAGVRSVGVSSGPEGEFVFKTSHDADVALKDVIPSLPGFGARVVAAGDGVVNVSARDPETEA